MRTFIIVAFLVCNSDSFSLCGFNKVTNLRLVWMCNNSMSESVPVQQGRNLSLSLLLYFWQSQLKP